MTARRQIGCRVLHVDSIASTNDLARERNETGLAIVADRQTAGRGQYGRRWESPPGASLLLSVTLAPTPSIARPVVLTAWAAVAVAETIEALTPLAVRIKWPNDLLIEGKKICGILCETAGLAVVGIGINLLQPAVAFATLPAATSLAILGHGSSPDQIVEPLLDRLDASYGQLLAGDFTSLETRWAVRLGLIHENAIAELISGETVRGVMKTLCFGEIVLAERSLQPEQIRSLSVACSVAGGP